MGCRVRPRCGAQGGGVVVGRLPSDAGMGAVNVVASAPVRERGAGVGQRREQGFVQQFVAQPSVEAFDKGILGRFAWRDTGSTSPLFSKRVFQAEMLDQLASARADLLQGLQVEKAKAEGWTTRIWSCRGLVPLL